MDDTTPPRTHEPSASAGDSEPHVVEAVLGEPFTLPLPAGAATGAEWRLDLPTGLRSGGESSASPSVIPGDPVDSLPLVIADAPGTYQVPAALVRPWDGSVLRSVTVRVTVV